MRWLIQHALAVASTALTLIAVPVAAETRPGPGGWPSLVSDQSASRVGDSLTVLIYENASASNSAQRGSRKATKLAGAASTDVSKVHRADLNLSGAFDGVGQTSRS